MTIFTIEDPWPGEREITSNLSLIYDQLKLLEKWRDDGRAPSRALLDDIAAYRAIVESDMPAERAEQYFEYKRSRDKWARPRHVARALEWVNG